MQVTKTFARCKDFDYVLLYSHYSISFQALIYWNCHLHKRFITRWSVSVVIVFPFLGAGFANIPPTFLISCEVQTRYSRTSRSRQYIRDQGKNLDLFWIWCCFQFFLHCLVQPNQDIHFLLHVIFIIRIRLWIIQTVNLYFLCF